MKNLEVLQAMAKALPKVSIRNYGSIVGYQDKKFWITDGFFAISYEPDFRDNSYPLPENDCSIPKNLIGESMVKFPSVRNIFASEIFTASDRLTNSLSCLLKIADFKAAKRKEDQLFLDLDRMSLTPVLSDKARAINPYWLSHIKKHLPKNAFLEQAWFSDAILKLQFNNRITAIILMVVS